MYYGRDLCDCAARFSKLQSRTRTTEPTRCARTNGAMRSIASFPCPDWVNRALGRRRTHIITQPRCPGPPSCSRFHAHYALVILRPITSSPPSRLLWTVWVGSFGVARSIVPERLPIPWLGAGQYSSTTGYLPILALRAVLCFLHMASHRRLVSTSSLCLYACVAVRDANLSLSLHAVQRGKSRETGEAFVESLSSIKSDIFSSLLPS